ncbi:DUF47 domain-containing protein [Amedibacillus sp. YH-ame6]
MNKKGYNYYSAFIKIADYAYKACEELNAIVQSFDTDGLDEHLEKMHELEHEADTVRHEIMEVLAKEFLPPIDREDIVALGNALDDMVDAVEDISIGLYVYNVQDIREEAIPYADVVLQCCEAVRIIMEEFVNFQKSKELMQYIQNVNALEGKGDMLYARTTRIIFTSDLDAVEVMKWRSIYDRMEATCDACEEVGRLVESVILKNS